MDKEEPIRGIPHHVPSYVKISKDIVTIKGVKLDHLYPHVEFSMADIRQEDKKLVENRQKAIQVDLAAFYKQLPARKPAPDSYKDKRDLLLCGVGGCNDYQQDLSRHLHSDKHGISKTKVKIFDFLQMLLVIGPMLSFKKIFFRY